MKFIAPIFSFWLLLRKQQDTNSVYLKLLISKNCVPITDDLIFKSIN